MSCVLLTLIPLLAELAQAQKKTERRFQETERILKECY